MQFYDIAYVSNLTLLLVIHITEILFLKYLSVFSASQFFSSLIFLPSLSKGREGQMYQERKSTLEDGSYQTGRDSRKPFLPGKEK